MKKILSNILRFVNQFLGLSILFLVDFGRYLFNSFGNPFNRSENALLGRVTLYYHAIEKGLSREDTRLGFGKYAIDKLFDSISLYINKGYSQSDHRFKAAIEVLFEYIKLHEQSNFDITNIKLKFEKMISRVKFFDMDGSFAGAVTLNKSELIYNKNIDFNDFLRSRKSIRTFSNTHVDYNVLMDAISVARHTPSACNRQPWKVHVIRSKEMINDVLKLQGGFKGLGNNLDTLLIVTADYSMFGSFVEKNAAYIDGGLFSMNLLLSLHNKNFATCTLNLSMKRLKEKQLRRLLKVPKNFVFILAIAVGNYKETFKITKSKRISIHDIVIEHN